MKVKSNIQNLLQRKSTSRENVLGASNSSVYRGTFDGKTVAVKRIERRYPSSPIEDREIKAQIHLNHRNVVKMIAAEQDVDFRY